MISKKNKIEEQITNCEPYIKSPRQKRAIETLIIQVSIAVKDIGELIGALNPCQIVMELRRQGFSDIILTRRYSVKDMDGRTCQPGEYYIPEALKFIAKETLKKYVAGKVSTPKATHQLQINVIKGE